MPVTPPIVIDSSVLIDARDSDLTVLELLAKHVGSIWVPRPLLREVDGLDANECARLGVDVMDGTIEQLSEAAASVGGPLSFEDRLCLIVARDCGGTCATNDGRLRTECQNRGVAVVWGLELLVELVSGAHLPTDEAIAIARAISSVNHYITPKIVEAFVKKVKGLS